MAVVVAAGQGTRLGAGMPKAFVQLHGSSLLRRSVDGLVRSGVVEQVVVVVPAGFVDEAERDMPADVLVVSGGAHRSDSVRVGLAVEAGATHVLVHDAARALTPVTVIRSVVARLSDGVDAVVPVVAVTDTIKQVTDVGVVTATPDRAALRAVQTPQGFEVGVLARAYDGAVVATDDAGLVERTGVAVHTVAGDPLAFKITTPQDWALAQVLAS